ncbi:MAG: trypsin-like peptidase domain-containing protein [Dehalococcoidia bacterium]|nr:trypsin-like peptidase domain-containing protein [Dehalococcoidia bacterium]
MRTQYLKLRRAILPLLLVLVMGTATLSACTSTPIDTAASPPPGADNILSSSPWLSNFADVIALVRPSVVAINTETPKVGLYGIVSTIYGAGSGWIIDSNGLIVTNNHVVDGASLVSVTLDDGRSFTANEIYTDAFSDLAVIKIDAHNLPAAKIGGGKSLLPAKSSNNTTPAVTSAEYVLATSTSIGASSLRIGDWLLLLGNSFGMGISVTKGIVSATGVAVDYDGNVLYNIIQTDATINASNSGGPIVNLAGEVVGISSAKVSAVGAEGMGYAISIEEAYPILQQLISDGYVLRPSIGATLYTVNKSIAMRHNLSVNHGAFIATVVQDGPAIGAGLRAGDVIVAIEETSVTSAENFKYILQFYEIGQEVQLTYYRSAEKRVAVVTLART